MQRRSFGMVALVGVAAVILMASGVGFLWSERTPETPGHAVVPTQESPLAAAPQQAHPLPEHPLEQMGVAGLTPSHGLPADSLSEERAIKLVTEGVWGAHRSEYIDEYPATAVPAVYNAQENAMGPAADGLAVWVVTLEGWGLPVPCGLGDLPSGAVDPGAEDSEGTSQDQRRCTPGQSNTYVIVDAKTGQVLGSWHYGEPVWE